MLEGPHSSLGNLGSVEPHRWEDVKEDVKETMEETVKESVKESVKERNFRCELCYKVLRSQATYRQHRRVHTRDQQAFRRKISQEDCQFPCGPCDLRFISEDVLKYHVFTTHQICRKTKSRQGEVRYQCIL